jgi:hypothetical protein
MSDRPIEEKISKTIRLPVNLVDYVQQLATENRRSFTGQVEFIIKTEAERDSVRVPLVRVNDPKK